MASAAYQTVAMRRAGLRTDHGKRPRAYWYRRLYPLLLRGGHLDLGQVISLSLAATPAALLSRTPSPDPFHHFQEVVTDLIGTWRLFTYEELGYEDVYQNHVGATRPEVVLLAEKPTIEQLVYELAAVFGFTAHITGGNPSLQATESLVKALRLCHPGPVIVVALVDFDCFGWRIADGFVDQLARYGMATRSLHFLVRPERFTPEEIRLYAQPISGDRRIVTLADRWVERSGGVGGKRLRIHCDHMRSLDRLARAVEEETGLAPRR